MRKPNLIIGRKHIMLASLTLILGIAIYMNYAFSSSREDDIPVDNIDASNYGDAAFVNAEGEAGSDYFAQARLARMISRDEAAETLSSILNGGDITEEEVAVYTNDAVTLSQLGDSEGKIETLIKAQGFEDCVVYLSGQTANIVVKSDGLEAAEAAQIKDILLSEVTLPTENIRIYEVQ